MRATIKLDENEVLYAIRMKVATNDAVDKIRDIRLNEDGSAEVDVELVEKQP